MASEHHVHATARFQIFEQGLELRFSRGDNLELHRGKSTFATVRHRNIGFADTRSVLLHNFHDKLGEIRSGIADHLDDVVTGKLDLRRFWLTHARYSRSEERRVGKECRPRWGAHRGKKNINRAKE